MLKAKLETLDDSSHTEMVVIEGGARGADRLARQVALDFGWKVVTFEAMWDTYGRAAGYIRNSQMLEEGKPEFVLAFWDGQSRGTKDMIEQSKAFGVPVEVVHANDSAR